MNRFFTIALLCNVSIALAQKPDSVLVRPAKNRNVDGTIMSSSRDIMDNISASPEFTTVTRAINAAGLSGELKNETLTFFAPANKAFDKLPPGTLDTLLLPAHKTDLINLVNYHIVPGRLTSKDIERQIRLGNGQATLVTLSGGKLTARINENRNIVLSDENGGESIVARLDIDQGNGMLFIVNTVLIPKPIQ